MIVHNFLVSFSGGCKGNQLSAPTFETKFTTLRCNKDDSISENVAKGRSALGQMEKGCNYFLFAGQKLFGLLHESLG